MDAIFCIDDQEEFQKAIEDFVNNYFNWSNASQPANLTFFKAAKEDLKQLLLDCNFDTNKVPELLVDKGWKVEKITSFVKLLNDKKTELLYATLINQNSSYGETISNFDWVLKLILGTSELNTLKFPLLQLVLSTESHGIPHKLSYDVNKDMLLKLINTLEKFDDM